MPDEERITQLSQQLAYFAQHHFRNTSAHQETPLYSELSRGASADPPLLELFTAADPRQPFPNLLFGAAQYLLLKGVDHPLRSYFASLTPAPLPPEQAYASFRDFCFQHAETMSQLVTTRRVQTNEVARCSALVPAFALVAKRSSRPLALLELGASAGLNLLWDQYHYDYGIAGQVGNADSPVEIVCEVRGEVRPPMPTRLPEVIFRRGLDLHPIDVSDPEAALWLRALIWPEHLERAALLEKALEVARRDPPHLVKGNLIDLLPPMLDEMPADAAMCLYHSFTFNQLAPELKDRVTALLAERSQQHDIYRVCIEWYSGEAYPLLELYTYRRGTVMQETLAACHAHGKWLAWRDVSPPTSL